MKVSVSWLQEDFKDTLPSVEKVAEAFTFHAFEIDSIEGDVLDVKVLPNRAADCLSKRGIAKELSAILDIPMKEDVLRKPAPTFPTTDKLAVAVDKKYVLRHMGALVSGVKLGPSPAWLRERLESLGQRSINNIVDATNYVMLSLGQPMHAFDSGKISWDKDILKIDIRSAKEGEKITILTGEEFALSKSMYVIADSTSGEALDVAGLKGGKASGITEATTDLFISVGNYDSTLIRKMAQDLKLFTDASLRFQNRPSPELTAYGMEAILALIKEVAGGELIGVIDVYPKKSEQKTVSITAAKVSKHLGADYSDAELEDVFRRLGFPFIKDKELFTVAPPFERTDLVIPEDLVEEVGRIIGYDKVPATPFPAPAEAPDQRRYRGIERMKDMLIEQGFIEVSTQSFTKKDPVELANPLDKTRPALRSSLVSTLNEALEKAKLYAPLVLLPNEKPKLFEVGTVFPKEGEFVALQMTERVPAWGDSAGTSDNLSVAKLEDYGRDYTPKRYELGPYKSFSIYPFVLRDIALWVPSDTSADTVQSLIKESAGDLLVRIDLFDTFEKEGRVSYAFRLVFQSMDRTLSDAEINSVMEKMASSLDSQSGFSVR